MSRQPRYCHASCCCGETALHGPDQEQPHVLQSILDRLGCPSGSLGKATGPVLQAMKVAQLLGSCRTSRVLLSLMEDYAISRGLTMEEFTDQVVAAADFLGGERIDYWQEADRAFEIIQACREHGR